MPGIHTLCLVNGQTGFILNGGGAIDLNSSVGLQKYLTQILKTGVELSETTPSRLDKIRAEWNKFIEGKPVNKGIVPKTIYESWQRSIAYGVDPYLRDERFECFIQQEEGFLVCD